MSGAGHIGASSANGTSVAACACDGVHHQAPVPRLSDAERERIRLAMDRAALVDLDIPFETTSGRFSSMRVALYAGAPSPKTTIGEPSVKEQTR